MVKPLRQEVVMRMKGLWIGLVFLLFLVPRPSSALVAEERPGFRYLDQVLFLEKKVVAEGAVAWITLAYADPRTSRDCRNFFDVLGGRELFADIPEKSWLLVDFELRSLVVDAGFSGDADVISVTSCGSREACLRERDRRAAERPEQPQVAVAPKSDEKKQPTLDALGKRLQVGRRLVKAARCRGCHAIEGFGADHAPSLTWRRHKYEQGWLKTYLAAPYRLRPAMTNLMMLAYTSPNAVPSLQPAELDAVADYLQQLAWMTSPANEFRLEPWQSYNCFDCHTRLYQQKPLAFTPTPLQGAAAAQAADSPTVSSCLACHAFGDRQPPDSLAAPMALAPDLLLAVEKLRLDYMQAYLQDPAYVQPGSQMPRLNLPEAQMQELQEFFRSLKKALAAGEIQPLRHYYLMEKQSVE